MDYLQGRLRRSFTIIEMCQKSKIDYLQELKFQSNVCKFFHQNLGERMVQNFIIPALALPFQISCMFAYHGLHPSYVLALWLLWFYPLFAAHIPLYLYPFLNTTSKTKPFEYLRLTSLGVIGALVKVPSFFVSFRHLQIQFFVLFIYLIVV